MSPWVTPEQAEERHRLEYRARLAEREGHEWARPPTVAKLVERMGWTWAYVDHLVQPYCTCGPRGDGGAWVVCAHATDLGVEAPVYAKKEGL